MSFENSNKMIHDGYWFTHQRAPLTTTQTALTDPKTTPNTLSTSSHSQATSSATTRKTTITTHRSEPSGTRWGSQLYDNLRINQFHRCSFQEIRLPINVMAEFNCRCVNRNVVYLTSTCIVAIDILMKEREGCWKSLLTEVRV